jgi:hypothetical protein
VFSAMGRAIYARSAERKVVARLRAFVRYILICAAQSTASRLEPDL